jgi:hypothetical protein
VTAPHTTAASTVVAVTVTVSAPAKIAAPTTPVAKTAVTQAHNLLFSGLAAKSTISTVSTTKTGGSAVPVSAELASAHDVVLQSGLISAVPGKASGLLGYTNFPGSPRLTRQSGSTEKVVDKVLASLVG